MENLNAKNIINEIQSLIKALKNCGGWVKRGNGEGWFNHEILADTLALITSQEQRIKELTEENERLGKVITDLIREGKMYLKQRDALQCRVNYLKKYDEERDIALHARLIAETRADTVRKMQERLMQKILENTVGNDSFAYFLKGYIDQIAKEILEEDQCQT